MIEKKVLIVDDEVNVLNALFRVFRNEPYQALYVQNTKEAMEIMGKHPIQVIISDQKMPEVTGIEFLQKVKDLYPDTVRVILSGHADINLLIDAINKEVVYRFLTKPWNDQEVKSVVRQCMSHHDLNLKNRAIMKGFQNKNQDAQGS
jgi:DNA-binding NtrC family response regulator